MVSAVDGMRIEDQKEMTTLINNNSMDCLSLEIDSVRSSLIAVVSL